MYTRALGAFAAPCRVPAITGICQSYQNTSNLSQKRARLLTLRRRRPRPVSQTTAIFIWSNNYDDEEGEDGVEDVSDGDIEGDGSLPQDSVDADAFDNGPQFPTRKNGINESWDPFNNSMGDDGISASFGNACDAIFSSGMPSNAVYSALRAQTTGPDDIDRMHGLTSDSATDAFRQVITGIFGNMPTDAYDIVITCDRASVSRLMQSALSTGYAIRNAEIRMLLNETMSSSSPQSASSAAAPKTGNASRSREKGEKKSTSKASAPSPSNKSAPTTMFEGFISDGDFIRTLSWRGNVDVCGVKGSVRWWDIEGERERQLDAKEYITRLEAENELLRERLGASTWNGTERNRLIEFMKTLNADKLSSLQTSLTADGANALKKTVRSVLGELDGRHVQTTHAMRRDYLAQVSQWCLFVGYTVRNIEKRLEMTKMFEETEACASPSNRDGDGLY